MKLSLKKELRDIFLIGLFGGFFTVVSYGGDVESAVVGAVLWVLMWKGNEYLVTVLDYLVDWWRRPVFRVMIGIFMHSVLSTFIFGLAMFFISYFYGRKLGFFELMALNKSSVGAAILITIIISMFMHGRAFYLNWKEALLREEKLKSESLKSRYESLKNQVNPHFLFNSLNVLSSLVYDDQKKAVAFIRKMSDVYRYVLEKKDEELVSIADELEFVNNYVYLQKIRFGENFILELNDAGVKGYVPPLAIQLLIENAIKHNVVSEARPLRVRLEVGKEEIVIMNNIQEKRTKDSTGIGLSNLIARYDHLSDNKVKITNDQKTFSVRLPILQLKK